MVEYQEQELTAAFAALADPTRRRLMEQLSQGERSVGELAAQEAISFAGVSKHLQVLERAGLLQRRREGRHHFLKLEPEPLKNVYAYIEFYRQFWESSLDRLAAHLETLNRSTNANANSDKNDHV